LTSDKPVSRGPQLPESTSDNTQPSRLPALEPKRRGRAPVALPVAAEAILAAYAAKLAGATMLDDDTRRAYTSRVRQYLAWHDQADLDSDPLPDPHARDGAVRDYRAHPQTVLKHSPTTINTVLAALADFHHRHGLGVPSVQRIDLPQRAPRAPKPRDVTRWQRAVER
jgi:hypothetical protein